MLISDKAFLESLGWDLFFEKQMPPDSHLVPARVIGEDRHLYRIQFQKGVVSLAVVTGKFQFSATSRLHYPAVGDWVLVDLNSDSQRALINQVLDRKTMIHRKQLGSGSDGQSLASNIDYIFITTSMNEDLNFRRIERYLAIAFESKATPVVLLTKADIQPEKIPNLIQEISAQFPSVSIHAISQNNFSETDFFENYLRPGKTAVVIGSSGVGKSTLINYLIGATTAEEKIKTQDIRDDDGKGRHTTTSRNLYTSRYGGLVIDTPGMRELQLSDHGEGVGQQFEDIENLFHQCKFSDCKHQTEPGCAVQAAFASGALTQDRWQSYQKLQAEVRFSIVRKDKQAASVEKKRWKKLTSEGQLRSKAKRGEST